MASREHHATGLIVVAILFLLWLLTKGKNVLHESVTATLLPSQSGTGIPQYDSSDITTIPASDVSPVAPIGSLQESITNFPSNPNQATCPAGYTLFYDRATGAYWCWKLDLSATSVSGLFS